MSEATSLDCSLQQITITWHSVKLWMTSNFIWYMLRVVIAYSVLAASFGRLCIVYCSLQVVVFSCCNLLVVCWGCLNTLLRVWFMATWWSRPVILDKSSSLPSPQLDSCQILVLQTGTDYGPYIVNEPSPLHTTTIVECCTCKLVEDWKYLRVNVRQDLNSSCCMQ